MIKTAVVKTFSCDAEIVMWISTLDVDQYEKDMFAKHGQHACTVDAPNKQVIISVCDKETLRDVAKILTKYHLSHLLGRMGGYILETLKSYFELLKKDGKDIPEDLDWVYSQYNHDEIVNC